MEVALLINGFDERLDAFGCEDCDFGVRAERAGRKTWIEPRAVTVQAQDRKLEQNDVAVSYRRMRPLEGDLSQCTSDPPTRTWTAGNDFSLDELRRAVLAGGSFPPPRWFPEDHWAQNLEGL